MSDCVIGKLRVWDYLIQVNNKFINQEKKTE